MKEIVLLDIGQKKDHPALARQRAGIGGRRPHRCREEAARVVEVMQGEADLLQVVFALDAIGGLAHLLHGRQQQADEHGNDGNHHQQFDQSKANTWATAERLHE